MTVLTSRTTQKKKVLTIFERIAEKDQTAVKDCVNAYGNFIWALAKKLTNSTEEAEAAAQEIFLDIWRYSEREDYPPSAESVLVALIARQRLIRYLQ